MKKLIAKLVSMFFITLTIGLAQNQESEYVILADNYYEVPAGEEVTVDVGQSLAEALPRAYYPGEAAPGLLIGKVKVTGESNLDINCAIEKERISGAETEIVTVFRKNRKNDITITIPVTSTSISLVLDNSYSVMTSKTVYLFLVYVYQAYEEGE